MQHINENMEDLFKKAAEHYPLNTGSADWNEVASRLEMSRPQGAITRIKNRKTILTVLLLLMIIPSTWYLYSKNGSTTNKINQPVANILKDNSDRRKSADTKPTNRQLDLTAGKQHLSKTNSSAQPYSNLAFRTNKTNPNTRLKENLSTMYKEAINGIAGTNIQLQNVSKFDSAGLDKISLQPVSAGSQKSNDDELPAVTLAMQDKPANPSYQPELSDAGKNKTPIVLHTKNTGFYIGISGAPTLSFVKMQSFQKPGFRYGVWGGYKFNDTWNVELGWFRSQEYFYTSASYFSSDYLKFWPTTTIKGINGYGYISEFPLSVKYNFPAFKKQHSYFAEVGISSQIINSEKYWYQLNLNNRKDTTQFRVYGKFKNLKVLSGVRLSAGYEAPVFNNFASLRIEPYCKIPVSGMGIGNVRVTDFGINMGITKYFK